MCSKSWPQITAGLWLVMRSANAQVVHLESVGEVASHHLLGELLPDVGEVGGVPGYHTNVARIALKYKSLHTCDK